jgi:hypothetical protein
MDISIWKQLTVMSYVFCAVTKVSSQPSKFSASCVTLIFANLPLTSSATEPKMNKPLYSLGITWQNMNSVTLERNLTDRQVMNTIMTTFPKLTETQAKSICASGWASHSTYRELWPDYCIKVTPESEYGS